MAISKPRTRRDDSKPLLLDLFCCEGGAGTGYARAGFEVVGVDDQNQRRYPFEFHQGDAIEYVKEHGHEFDAIHASPPCQAYSITRHSHSKQHPDLLGPTREALRATGKPFVIENVPGAPMHQPIMLCGSEFDITAHDPATGERVRLQRHRLFESNIMLYGAGGCRHDKSVQVAGVYGGGSPDRDYAKHVRKGGYTPAKHVRAELIGCDWMTLHGLSQAVPPVYTEHIGRQLLFFLESRQYGN